MPARPSASAAAQIHINRAPVLTLWAVVVAERLGFSQDEALTLGRAVAGLNAQSKGRALGIFKPATAAVAKRKQRELKAGETLHIVLLERAIPALNTPEGIRALDSGDRPSNPEAVERYLEGKFGASLAEARQTMIALAASFTPAALAERAYALYESFRPEVPAGTSGWGAKGVLDLGRIRSLARRGE